MAGKRTSPTSGTGWKEVVENGSVPGFVGPQIEVSVISAGWSSSAAQLLECGMVEREQPAAIHLISVRPALERPPWRYRWPNVSLGL
jgi:hypothetical protein